MDVAEADDYVRLTLRGELDAANSVRLRELLTGMTTAGQSRIVVDLDGVTFLDSTGLGVLVGALKETRSNDGALHLVCTTPQVRRLFDITGLATRFDLFDSADQAIAALAH